MLLTNVLLVLIALVLMVIAYRVEELGKAVGETHRIIDLEIKKILENIGYDTDNIRRFGIDQERDK